MSLGKWPALSGGSAITLDIRLPHSFGSPCAGWVEALVAYSRSSYPYAVYLPGRRRAVV